MILTGGKKATPPGIRAPGAFGYAVITRGEVAERSKAAVLKTVMGQPIGGSNPSLSATNNK